MEIRGEKKLESSLTFVCFVVMKSKGGLIKHDVGDTVVRFAWTS
jgi:hypothetical protein